MSTAKLLFGGWARPVAALTASTYSAKPRDCGKVFTNRGATGTVTITLPKVSAALAGWWIEVVRVAAQSLVVASETVDTLVISADAAADTVTIASIGHGVHIWCDGSQMFATLMPGAAATIISGTTVAT